MCQGLKKEIKNLKIKLATKGKPKYEMLIHKEKKGKCDGMGALFLFGP
jgi:hypothetical protein